MSQLEFPTDNPWQTLESKPIYTNPWIELTEHQVINPSGGRGIYGVVHFRNIAVGVLPLDEENYTWLVGQYRYALREYSWEIPEGGCLIGKESPLDTAKRELLEETGLQAQDWTPLLKLHTSNSVTDEVGYAFVARGLTQHAAQPEDTEQLQVKRLPFQTVYEMALRGDITDSLSLATIFKAYYLLNSNQL